MEFFIYQRDIPIPEDKDELAKQILHQNEVNTYINDPTLRILVKRQTHRGTHIVMLVDSYTKKFLNTMKQGKVAWRYGTYKVSNHVHIIRCYRCQGYGHRSDRCQYERPYCKFCSEPHDVKQCDQQYPCCINCCDRNKKFNTRLNYMHPAHHSSCTVYQEILTRESRKQQ
jgi:hypothetical protein